MEINQTSNSFFKTSSGINPSLWIEEGEYATSPLTENIEAEVCIIGAGIAGLSIAYHLVQAGKQVVILEAKQIGSGESGRTTAHLSNAYDDRYYKIAKMHGEKIARLVAESHTQAIQSIEQIIQNEKIDCDFKRVDGYLFSNKEDENEVLYKEEKAALKVGLNVHLIDSPKIRGFLKKPVLQFTDQAQFHPMKYLNGLANAITQQKGLIFTQTSVVEVKPGKIIQLKTDSGHLISAQNVVIATNAPIFDNTFSFAKQSSNRSYVIAGLIPKDSIEHALFWDTASPYHYVRMQPYNDKEDIVIIGGEDHRTGDEIVNDADPFKKLEHWYLQIFPPLKKVIYTWSGQIQEPSDYLAYIGRLKGKEKNIFIVTGDSGNGMTHGALSGILIKDLILNQKNPWEKVYNPSRSAFKNLSHLIQHNLISALNYFRYLLPSWNSKLPKKGEGKIVCNAWEKTAVYKDEKAQTCKNSPRCTHMNAPLRWNPIEKTWDCPAHGSRFSPCGQVLQGPANKPLKGKK